MKAVEAPGEVTIDDEFAKTLGLELLAKLRDAVKERIAREHAAASRQKLKRALLDQLDERHKFEPPPSLVEQEFDNVWSQIENDSSSRTAPSPTKERPRKRRGTNIAPSPSGACGWAWSSPRSARRTISR